MKRLDTNFEVEGVSANLRFKYVKFDGNGCPKFTTLAEVLADHITQFCFSIQRRRNPQSFADYNRLNREAKNLLRRIATSGESGEILLYYLIEAVLKAPQLVAKMDLKTNPSLEINGSDGIHFKWDEKENILDIYFGESKLERNLSDAIDHALISIKDFHKNRLDEHELAMVTGHFKWASDELKSEVLKYIDKHSPDQDCRYNHACLIGWNWSKYQKLQTKARDAFIKNFEDIYKLRASGIARLINNKFQNFHLKHLRFEIFLLPFESVQAFRDEFIRATS
ncbi:DUF1837 domain-containing protein [Nitratidesulfovibrio sp. HK-II]|nr:DUF1837 domain-containing protein [Nitratidesulfovibrio sp. HK-II]